MLLDGKSVIVTGASRGVGRAVAIACARHGANVVINHPGDLAEAESAKAEVERLGRRVMLLDGDIADPETPPRLVAASVSAFGKLDVLVNNAGICPFHDFLDLPEDLYRRTMAVNLDGAFRMTQAAARQMKDQGHGGSVVSVSSISALVGGGGQTHYTPTKAGIHSLMQSCAIALSPWKIRCNSVMPGTIETDINRDDLSDAKKRAYMEGRIPAGRLGAPEDVADPVVFLASDMARYVNGAALLVDGGLYVNLQ